jgi:CheY-like chemotaxis protein
LEKQIIRVLVVDDYEPWRRLVSKTLCSKPELRFVGEASDGLQAVHRSQELQPDLVLLDIGLPILNGIEAARQILERVPKAKILFVSENRSQDIAELALRLGASGYLVKLDAASALLSAVETVLKGQRFLSGSLSARDLPDSVVAIASDQLISKDIVAPIPRLNFAIHEVAFYSDDAAFVDGFVSLIEAALKVGNAAILIASDSHRARILQKLKTNHDVDAAIQQGALISWDAAATLSTLMVNGLPDPIRCAKAIHDLVTTARNGARRQHPRVAICGECAPTLLANGDVEAAIRLEHMWDELIGTYDADTLCGYLWSAFPSGERSLILERICAEHSATHGRELGW